MNNPGIFLIQPDGELLEMNEQAPPSEDQLQSWLEKYPSLLAGHQIDPDEPRRWLLVERECGVPSQQGGGERWAADHLFLDQDAVPTIVEVKRGANTEIRRKIVGQMLDYAANAIVHWPIAYMQERFAATCENCGLDADEKLSDFLGEDANPEEFWARADRNLRDGNIRLLFVADDIPTELQRIIEFLNEQMDRTEVLGVEIKQFVRGVQTALAPRVIGRTAEAQQKKSTTMRDMTPEEVIEAIGKKSSAEAAVAQRILDWSNQNFTEIGSPGSSFVPALHYGNRTFRPIAVSKSKYARVQVRFGHIKKRNSPFDLATKRNELLRRLNEIPGVKLRDSEKFPSIPLSALTNEKALDQFLKAIGWTIEEVRSARQDSSITALSQATS
jgi:hypothetical protein